MRTWGSIIIVVATDAPLIPQQLKRLARRASLGLARTGSISGNGSGDLFIAFSTANPQAGDAKGLVNLTMLPNDQMNATFEATVQATEEAIINAMLGAQTTIGYQDHKVIALPHDRLQQVLRKYGQMKLARSLRCRYATTTKEVYEKSTRDVHFVDRRGAAGSV